MKTTLLIPIVAAIVVTGAGAMQYRSEALRDVPVAMEDGAEVSGMLAQELRALHSDVPPAISQYQAITDKNLFSPDRRAWAPPPPPSSEDEPEEEPVPPLSGPSGVRLYGTTVTPERKTALLFFERFRSDRKHRLLAEGETARDDGEKGSGVTYRLVSLEQDKAVLEDGQAREIVVGLYDHQRAAPPPPPVEAPKAPQPSAPAARPATAPEVQPQGEPIRRMEDIPQALEEREELARQGRLRRISTPFGPAFRPIE